MKVTVDSIEFAWFSMYMPCDKGYTNHGLFEYIDLMKRVKYVTKLHLNILYGVILTQSYHGILSRQELSVHLLIMNICFFYVLMSNVLIYLIHTAQRAMAVSQQYTILQNTELHESIIKLSLSMNSDFF